MFLSSFGKTIILIHKNMTRKQLKFEDFNAEKLSKNQQKVVRGGDAEPDPIDPGKATGNGNG